MTKHKRQTNTKQMQNTKKTNGKSADVRLFEI